MVYYRLYTLGSPGGAFIGAEEISAIDDVEAVRLARTMEGDRPMELWCGKRKVKSFGLLQPEAV